ncbi:MAG: NAD(P)/FAD-dependent oxidoreductase [archaeon]|nr:NAD(P)/FAD-dependent oxidoreductase [archaeon]
MQDSIVVGSGPNGLAAAIFLQKAGYSTTIYESKEKIGGGARSSELTLKGFTHDICSAVYPLSRASPFFRDLPLEQFGLEWITPPAAFANPFDDGTAAIVWNSLEETASSFDNRLDGEHYSSLLSGFLKNSKEIIGDILGPIARLPKKPIDLLSFAVKAVVSVSSYAQNTFRGKDARAILGGSAAHSMLSLEEPLTNGFAMILLGLAHSIGWPIPKGGAQKIADSLGDYFISLGGRIETDFEVKSLSELPQAKVVLFDLTPRQILRIFGDGFPNWYSRSLGSFKYGPGVYKLDYALDGPIPWKSEECLKAGTVHVCGTLRDIMISERSVWDGREPEKPFVIVAQHSLFDKTRAPDGKHTVWAYCHVPNGSDVDMHRRIESQIERFAPGFQSKILARHTFTAMELEDYNPNYVGGDINGGLQNLWQTISRPVLSLSPYKTPIKGIYICSSSTPPGGGVHGMCGYYAAKSAISNELSKKRR